MSHSFIGMLTLAVVAPLGMLGCSDPVPESAGVGLRLQVSGCSVTKPEWTIGNPAPNSGANQFGKPIFSGSSGVTVNACRVTSQGIVTASLNGPDRLGFEISNSTVNLNQADAQYGKGTANISFLAGTQTWMTQPFEASDQPCTFEVIQTTTGLKISPGAVWASFRCFNARATLAQSCSVIGEIVLERCSGD